MGGYHGDQWVMQVNKQQQAAVVQQKSICLTKTQKVQHLKTKEMPYLVKLSNQIN